MTWFPITTVIGLKHVKFLGINYILSTFAPIFDQISQFRCINRYAMFAAMHDYRYEFELQGSYTGNTNDWKRYQFKYKPLINEYKPAPTCLMHWPRLDWMIWFIPLQLARNTSHFNKIPSPPNCFTSDNVSSAALSLKL